MRIIESFVWLWLAIATVASILLYLTVIVQSIRGKQVGRQPWETIATILHFALVAPIMAVVAVWAYIFRRRRN